jgi:hypothetical protein
LPEHALGSLALFASRNSCITIMSRPLGELLIKQ